MTAPLSPRPYPNECVFGIAARFAGKWFGASRRGAGYLFGRPTAPADRTFSRYLSDLATQLPASAHLDAALLAYRHTSLPLFLPFISPELQARATEVIGAGGHLPFVLGSAQSRIPCPKHLRLCEPCMTEDLQRFGQSYWHREHQITGVEVCPKHHLPLSISDLMPHRVFGSQQFGTPHPQQVIGAIEIKSEWMPHLIGLAEDIYWLLNAETPRPGPHRLHAYYTKRLRERDFLRPDGSVRLRRLKDAIDGHFGSDLLGHLHCSVPINDRGGWLGRLTRRHRYAQHPLRHILLLHFLGTSCEEGLREANACVPAASRQAARPHPNRIKCASHLLALLPSKRDQWLHALKSNPTHSVRACESALYAWLWRNDRDWLRLHQAVRISSPRSARPVWLKRDHVLAKRVPIIASRLRSARSPFRRASYNAIASQMENPSWLQSARSHLPATLAAVRRHVETTNQFAARRILEVSRKDPSLRAPWRIRVLAGVSTTVAARPVVAKLINQVARRQTPTEVNL